jgi:hypothetical protein
VAQALLPVLLLLLTVPRAAVISVLLR